MWVRDTTFWWKDKPPLFKRGAFLNDFKIPTHVIMSVDGGKPTYQLVQDGCHQQYCWWTKSCTTKDDDYPIIYRFYRVLTIPGGAGWLPSPVYRSLFCNYPMCFAQQVFTGRFLSTSSSWWSVSVTFSVGSWAMKKNPPPFCCFGTPNILGHRATFIKCSYVFTISWT